MSDRFVCQHSRKVGVQNAVFYSRVRINALALFHQFFVKRVNLSVILRRRGNTSSKQPKSPMGSEHFLHIALVVFRRHKDIE